MNKKGVCLTLGIMCAVLTYGICMQMKTVRGFGVATGGTSTQNKYKEDILKTKEKYDNVYRDLEHLNKELEKERANATQNDTELAKIEEEIKQINKLLGLTDVSGKGVKIVLKDSSMPASNYFGESSDLVVHDKYIMHIVNELYNAGAEAISINEQRIILTTPIICGGNIITINGEKIGSPFEIKAIGLPETLANLSRPGGVLNNLEDERKIKVSIKKSNDITIPKYSGVLNFKYLSSTN